MRWNEKITMAFVKIYLKYEWLWNPEHQWFRLKNRRDTALLEIIAEFKSLTDINMTIPEIKVKIKNLRSTYAQEVQKVLQKSTADSVHQPSLAWFNLMHRRLKHRPSNSRTAAADSSQEVQEADSEHTVWSSAEKILASFEDDESEDPLITLSYSDSDNLPASQSYVKHEHEQESSPENEKIYREKRKQKRLKKIPRYFFRSQSDSSNEDEFDIYGKYIASQLRIMGLQKALHVQMDIQNLINKARLAELDNSDNFKA